MNKVTEIIEFFNDNREGFKNQIENNLKLSYTDRVDEIFEESLNIIIKTLETFKENK